MERLLDPSPAFAAPPSALPLPAAQVAHRFSHPPPPPPSLWAGLGPRVAPQVREADGRHEGKRGQRWRRRAASLASPAPDRLPPAPHPPTHPPKPGPGRRARPHPADGRHPAARVAQLPHRAVREWGEACCCRWLPALAARQTAPAAIALDRLPRPPPLPACIPAPLQRPPRARAPGAGAPARLHQRARRCVGDLCLPCLGCRACQRAFLLSSQVCCPRFKLRPSPPPPAEFNDIQEASATAGSIRLLDVSAGPLAAALRPCTARLCMLEPNRRNRGRSPFPIFDSPGAPCSLARTLPCW